MIVHYSVILQIRLQMQEQPKISKIGLPNSMIQPKKIDRESSKEMSMRSIIRDVPKKLDPAFKKDQKNERKIFFTITKTLIQYYSNLQIKAVLKDEDEVKRKEQEKQKRNLNVSNQEQRQVITILNHYLGEFKDVRMDREFTDIPFEQWEKQNIKQSFQQMSLGMYVIKLPNPDNPPEDLLKKFEAPPTDDDEVENGENKQGEEKKQKEIQCRELTLKEALEMYYDLFSMVHEQNKHLAEKQKIAFHLAYYLLAYREYIAKPDLELVELEDQDQELMLQKQKSSALANAQVEFESRTMCNMRYYQKIQPLKVKDYNNERRDINGDIRKLQKNLDPKVLKQFQIMLSSFDKDNKTAKVDIIFDIKKNQLLQNIRGQFSQYLDYENAFLHSNKIEQSQRQETLMLKQFERKCYWCPALTDLLIVYHLVIPALFRRVILDSTVPVILTKAQKIASKNQLGANADLRDFQNYLSSVTFRGHFENRNEEGYITRKLCRGQMLKKVVKGEEIMWQRQFKRPKDILTLIRYVMIYKLTQRAHMFVRQFISKDTKYIYLVITANEPVLQSYAQKVQYTVQVDTGSIDVFSFEPIDSYYRPLRLSKYIHEEAFIQKYQVDVNKKPIEIAEDEDDISNSIDTCALNHLMKSMELNDDQLRVLIIEQQAELLRAYKWISDELNVNYIQSGTQLYNEFNQDQVTNVTWQVYYVYVKYILDYHKRVQTMLQKYAQNTEFLMDLKNNLGMIYRMIFIKSMQMANKLYQQYNDAGCLRNSLRKGKPLINLWDYLGIKEPTCFTNYINRKKYQRLWRKYEINQRNVRSKFVSSQRAFITAKILQSIINLSSGINSGMILAYFPCHDPYILKGIKIEPYFKPFFDQKVLEGRLFETVDNKLPDLVKQFLCDGTQQDFTAKCIQQKLQFSWGSPTDLSIEVIRNYGGERIALYFNFIKFVTQQSKSIFLISFIFQCIFWAQSSSISATGTSPLTQIVSYLTLIFSLFNIGWCTILIQNWRHQQRQFEVKYGLNNLSDEEQKRAFYYGEIKRNTEDDTMNYEYTPSWKKTVKVFYSTIINIIFVALVITTMLTIFVFKGYLIQSGLSPSISNNLPTVLISVATQIFNFLYKAISKKLTQYQNLKTVSEFESSLVFKTFLINFINQFNPLFMIAFLSPMLPSIKLCATPTGLGTIVENCAYQVYNQTMSSSFVSVATEIVNSLMPFIMFKVNDIIRGVTASAEKTSITKNYFESLDLFFEEQDNMEKFKFNEEIDGIALQYMNFMIRLSSIALFAPAFPLAFCVILLHGIVKLHSNKYKILFLSQRSFVRKQKTIGVWLKVLEVVTFLGLLVNLCYSIFTRNITNQGAAKILISFALIMFLFKYYISLLNSQPSVSSTIQNKRSHKNVYKALVGLVKSEAGYIEQKVNTDIKNVDYKGIDRKLPRLGGVFFKQ